MRILFNLRGPLLALLLALGSLLPARATHVRGGEITYARVPSTTAGVPRYHVLITLYCDPANQNTLQTDVTLNATRDGCNGPGSFQVTLPRSTNVLPASGTAGCASVYYHLYTFDTDLDLPAGQWTLSVTAENRVADIVNIGNANSVNINLFLATYLDNTLTDQDSSPRFESQVLPFLDASGPAPASFAAFDAEGDSLVYTYELPRQQANHAYGVPNGCGTVISGSLNPPMYQLDPASGALLPLPGAQPQGFYNVTGRVSEYRRLGGQWQLLGYVNRDLLYIVAAPSTPANHAPAFTALAVNGTTQPLARPIVAYPGQALSLLLTAADPDAGQQLRFSSSAVQVVPGLTLSTLSATQTQVRWQVPTTLPPGRYSLAFDAFDNACPVSYNATLTLTVVVTNQPLAARTSLNDAHEVYPVPFREQVRFRAAPGQAVLVTDALGRAVAQLQAGPDGLVLWQPGQGLPPGLYLARSTSGQPLARLLRE